MHTNTHYVKDAQASVQAPSVPRTTCVTPLVIAGQVTMSIRINELYRVSTPIVISFVEPCKQQRRSEYSLNIPICTRNYHLWDTMHYLC